MAAKEIIILAGGLGTRLRDVLPDLPKCMAPVNGKPFITYVIDHFLRQGIEKFIFSLGYKHEVISNYLNDAYTSFRDASAFQYSLEDEPLGTGGAIRQSCDHVTGKTVLVVNGDTLFRVTISMLAAFHNMCGADCTLALKPMKNFNRYGAIELNEDYSIRSFSEKKFYEEGLINGGVYVLNVQKFLRESLPVKFSFEKEYLEPLFNQRRMYGVVQDEYFIDIGIPEDYRRAQEELGVRRQELGGRS